MGQYFSPTFLDTTGRIIAALAPSDYGSGLKLSGHGRADTPLMWAVEAMLSLDGGLRLVWAGDYAPEETGADANLYFLAEERHFVRFHGLVLDDVEPTTALPTGFVTSDESGYFCNADKRHYIDKADLPLDAWALRRNPLAQLTAEGGDQPGPWARDRLFYTHSYPGDDWTPSTAPALH